MTRARKLTEPQAWRRVALMLSRHPDVFPGSLVKVRWLLRSGEITRTTSARMHSRFLEFADAPNLVVHVTDEQFHTGRVLLCLWLALESAENPRGRAR